MTRAVKPLLMSAARKAAASAIAHLASRAEIHADHATAVEHHAKVAGSRLAGRALLVKVVNRIANSHSVSRNKLDRMGSRAQRQPLNKLVVRKRLAVKDHPKVLLKVYKARAAPARNADGDVAVKAAAVHQVAIQIRVEIRVAAEEVRAGRLGRAERTSDAEDFFFPASHP